MWKIREPIIEFDDREDIVNKILKIRGIQDTHKFLHPSRNDINNPFMLSNMERAVEIISNGIREGKVFGVYGDIDTDGVTSLTQMVRYLEDFGITPYVLYHQRKEGHGVIVDYVPEPVDVLIIVDSSSNSIDECKQLTDRGIDVVILDHHIGEENPYATVVNPQYNDYPNKELSGAGVVYQTMCALDTVLETDYASKYIDICTIGLIGDMMDLSSPETRALVYQGLKKIQDDCYPQLKLILKQLKKDYKPNTTDIAFYVVPFINSIIRLGKIEGIINILLSDDDKECKKLIKECVKMNDKRKELQSDLLEKLEPCIDDSHNIIVVVSTDKNSNLNGLVANNIAQKYQKPTLVLKENEGMLSGSGRGYNPKIDFRQILLDSGLCEYVEGHDNSFGIEIKKENVKSLYEYCDNALEKGMGEKVIEYDLVFNEDEITWDMLRELEPLYFIAGTGFKEPTFLVKDLSVNEAKTMKEVHIKLKTDELECVKFNLSEEEIEEMEGALMFDGVGTLTINSWYNFGTKQTVRTKQMKLDDVTLY